MEFLLWDNFKFSLFFMQGDNVAFTSSHFTVGKVVNLEMKKTVLRTVNYSR